MGNRHIKTNVLLVGILLLAGCESEWNTSTFSGKPLQAISAPEHFSENIKPSSRDLSCVFWSPRDGRISVLASFRLDDDDEEALAILKETIFRPHEDDTHTYRQKNPSHSEWKYVANDIQNPQRATFLHETGQMWVLVGFDLHQAVDWKRVMDSVQLATSARDIDTQNEQVPNQP